MADMPFDDGGPVWAQCSFGRAALGRRELAMALAEKGVALRDVGDVLGMSFQRVQQLISA